MYIKIGNKMDERFLENPCMWAPGDTYKDICNSKNLENTPPPWAIEWMSKLCPGHTMESSTVTCNNVGESQLKNVERTKQIAEE